MLFVIKATVVCYLQPYNSISGVEQIFISLLKSAAFSLQTSENNLKFPQNHFKGQIGG